MSPVSKTAIQGVYAQWLTNNYHATKEISLLACELYDIYMWRMAWVMSFFFVYSARYTYITTLYTQMYVFA